MWRLRGSGRGSGRESNEVGVGERRAVSRSGSDEMAVQLAALGAAARTLGAVAASLAEPSAVADAAVRGAHGAAGAAVLVEALAALAPVVHQVGVLNVEVAEVLGRRLGHAEAAYRVTDRDVGVSYRGEPGR